MTEPAAPASPDDVPAQEPGEPLEAKADIDWKAKARDWEKRAKANSDAATRLAKIEEANKTEVQRAADRLSAAEKDAADARRDALRYRIASKFQVGDEDAELFLTGDDEDTLTRQAKRLTERDTERKKQGNFVPREGNNPTPDNGSDREAVRSLFGGG